MTREWLQLTWIKWFKKKRVEQIQLYRKSNKIMIKNTRTVQYVTNQRIYLKQQLKKTFEPTKKN